ncbi:MAG: hypothetical protein EU529_16625 [Promethearchaeota archaeon]|nr:MAG: hypothetical protein EU529_16625 [Candidatus Lokiarchaeota archaeon]
MVKEEGLCTTVVGSFPLENTKENMVRAFEDEINIGIDYPCYPQLIGMNYQFLSPLAKIIDPLDEIDEKFFLNDDFKIPDKPVALEYGQFMVDFLNDNPGLKSLIKGTKACLTGPFTLASEIILKDKLAEGITPVIFKEARAIMEGWIVDKLAEIMKKIGKAYSDMGINIISMDEPILGLLVGRKVWFHTEDFIVETLNKALSGIKDLSSIHCCGKISPKLRDLLLQTDVKVMDHEFIDNESNFRIFEKNHFENTDKYLAIGTVQTKVAPIKNGEIKDYVEKIEFLKKYIKKAIDLYGKENLVIKPDCGFGPLLKTFGEENGYKIALGKLTNMVKAVQEIK